MVVAKASQAIVAAKEAQGAGSEIEDALEKIKQAEKLASNARAEAEKVDQHRWGNEGSTL